MADSLRFDSYDLSGTSYGLKVLEDSFPLMAAPMIDTRQIAQGFGGVSRHDGYGSLSIPVPALIIGDSVSDLWSKMDAIKLLMDPNNGEKNLQFDFIPNRYWKAILSSPLEMPGPGVTWKRVQMEFLASDPRAYSTSDRSTPDFTINSTPDQFTEAVAGTATADPIWIVKAGASVTSVILENATTGESVTWTGTLSSGHWLKFNTVLGTIEKSTDSGANYTNVATGITGSFVLPKLRGGFTNTINVTGVSAGTLTLTYTARYI